MPAGNARCRSPFMAPSCRKRRHEGLNARIFRWNSHGALVAQQVDDRVSATRWQLRPPSKKRPGGTSQCLAVSFSHRRASPGITKPILPGHSSAEVLQDRYSKSCRLPVEFKSFLARLISLEGNAHALRYAP